jgi:hypothetical protein
MSFKKISLRLAYENGVRHCPCCNTQMVWKSFVAEPQKNLATVDHIVPYSAGGANTVQNVFVMCRKCNSERNDACFVEFVTSRGVSKSLAETLYHEAFISTFQTMIYNQFNLSMDRKECNRVCKKRRKIIRDLVGKYTEYFGDYLPEFKLLQRLL